MGMENGVKGKEVMLISTKEHIKMIRSMVKGILYGLVETNIKEAIKMINDKEKDK